MKKKILLVDDDPRLRELVRIALERAHFEVISASDGRMAVVCASRDAPDLIVLDIGLPELDGFDVCRKIRTTSDVPIIFLSARDDELDKILGLELGADDYVSKPFSPRELVARVRAVLKRNLVPSTPNNLIFGPLVLDRAAHFCALGAAEIVLTSTEFILLEALLHNPHHVKNRTHLIHTVWGVGAQVSDRTLDSHLRNLRSKFAIVDWPNAIETVHGVGFRMRALENP
ncbi:MAG: response regulator transcription factor [Roseobacter sp.]